MNWQDFFTAWPFNVTPDPGAPIVWAGRATTQLQVAALIKQWQIKPQSSFDLIWAAFGAGKTHLQLFVGQRADVSGKFLPWPCVVPRSARRFSEIYRALMDAFPLGRAVGALTESMPDSEIAGVLRAIAFGSPEQRTIATDWLRGRTVDYRSVKRLIDVPHKLAETSELQRTLMLTIQAVAAAGTRVVLLLDEFQRVRSYSEDLRQTVGATFLDIFNATPRNLSFMFSCSAAQQASALGCLPAEIISRMQGRRPFILPPLNEEEAVAFAKDLMRGYRDPAFQGEPTEPFSNCALRRAIHEFSAATPQVLPRDLIALLDQALMVAINCDAEKVEDEHFKQAADNMATLTQVAD